MRLNRGRTLLFAAIAALALVPVVAFAWVGAPDPLTAIAGDDPVIATLSWGASPEAVRYSVSVATAEDGPFEIIAETDQLTYDYTEGVGGIAYYFRVDAIDAAGEKSLPAASPVGPVTAAWASNPHVAATTTSDKCDTCHVLHKAAGSPLMRSTVATEPAGQTATCLVCHDGDVGPVPDVTVGARDSFSLASGHTLDTSFASGGMTRSCASCHDGHAVAATSPMVPLETIGGNTVSSAGVEWCTACHDEKAVNTWYPSGYPDLSAPDRDGNGYPVLGTWPGSDTYAGSTNPHRLIPESTQTAGSGQSVRRDAGDCLYCHAAHRGPNAYDGLVGTFRPTTASTVASDRASGQYAAACFNCHGGTVPSGFTTAPANIKQFAVSADPSSTAGHRVKTAGGTLPVGAPLPCYECHNPHGSSRGNAKMISDVRGGGLLTSTSDAAMRRFCFTCHSASDTGRGWNTASGSFVTLTAADKVVGIPRTGGVLKLPTMVQHSEIGTVSCVDCHGDSYGATGYNVHKPRDILSSHTVPTAGTDNVGGSTTDYHAADVPYSLVCTDCHSSDLSAEHLKSSTSTGTLSAYPDVCTGCHTTKVDAFAGPWDGSCSGNADSCHPGEHTGIPAAHDASSQVMASPGSESLITTSVATIVNEGWESGTYTTNGWTYAPITATGAHTGTYTARLQASANNAVTTWFWKEFDTSAVSTPTLEFWSNTAGFLAGDKIQVYYTTTGLMSGTPNVPWIPLYTPASGAQETVWTKHTYPLPRAKSVIMLFTFAYVSSSNTSRYVYYDDIKITGTSPPVWTTTAVPAGSTATRSCGAGYLDGAANCHDVSSLPDIHSKATTTVAGSTYRSCEVCHRDGAAVPTTANCQSVGCHPGVNGATHSTDYHESQFASNTVGPFAGTGFEPEWCTGCHFAGIAEDHRRLDSYKHTGCAICHKKSADTPAPLSVTSSDTSQAIHADDVSGNVLCTDCHGTVTAQAPHPTLGAGEPQFEATYSGHRAYPGLRGAVTSGTIGVKTIVDWSLPADSLWLKSAAVAGNPAAQLTPGSMVVCTDCHGSITGASGPHGATMLVNYAINEATGQPYDDSYSSGALYVGQFFPDWDIAMSNTTSLCNKCHVRRIDYNFAHTLGHHQGAAAGKCINCHSPVPHSWKRPRLLAYTTDPAPYASSALTGIRYSQDRNPLGKNATTNPNGWDSGYCSTNCGGHQPTMSATFIWP